MDPPNLACLGACDVLGFAIFRDSLVGWIFVRFLSVSLFRSFFFVSSPNLACDSVASTTHPSTSRRFQRVREQASGS